MMMARREEKRRERERRREEERVNAKTRGEMGWKEEKSK